ncbi:hypothetical protein K2Z83_25315 [Oscillochloris sp. ZM17-4]|uniref:hypothetical protein n=1 Tax=Oscillochloris sp. ZM17-4 TaxID=2866714 RepID=UPI001C72BA12|nr:hypothetical protein [Oscillochloris sp. ZM17-4]MBX0330978.1 hypothetical protein [Oscillochloris sp. ZM17-4]
MLLRFDGQGGRFAQLSVRGYSADLAQRPDLGVYLYDPRGAPLLDPYAAPVASYQATDSGLVLTRQSPANAIKVEERWTAHPSYIGLEGRVTSTEQVPSSRGVEACVQLPLDLVGMQWHGQLDRSERIERRPAPYKTVLTRLVDIGSFGDASLHLKSDLDFNLNGVNLIGDATFGLAMAIDSEHPAAYYVSYDASRETYSACFHLGIDKDHVRDNRSATFSLALFSPDNPDQGLRSALKKYISIYPDSFLGALPRATGMVVGDTYNYKEYPDPERYHIQSVWGSVKAKSKERGIYSLAYLWPTGFYDRDMRMKAAPVAGGGDQSWEADIAACLKIYADYEQQQNPFAESCVGSYPFATCQPSRASGQTYGPVYHSESSGWYTLEAFQVTVSNEPNFLFGKFVMRDPIARSLLQDETGGHVKAMSYASAMSEAFWDPGYKRCYFDGIDPDPGLEVTPSREPAPGPAPTQTDTFGELNLEIAKRANGLYGSDYLDTHPEEGLSLFSGAAIDNVGVYLRQDFNPQMLRVASLPLGYDPATASVVAFEHLSMLAFLRALRASLPPEAPIATNGVPISGLLGEGVDFFINEMIPIARDGATVDKIYDETLANKLRLIDRIRMVVNQRPVTLMAVLNRAADEQDLLAQIQTYLPLYTAKGIYINIDRYGQSPEKYFWVAQPKDPAVLAAYRRHLDTVYALNVAGWEPETFARPVDSGGQADPAVLAERFGSGLYTLYNADSQAKRVDLVIDWKRAGFSAAPLGATDHETGAALPLTASGDTLTIAGLQLAPNTVQVIELR